MSGKNRKVLWIIIVFLLIAAVVAFYLYDVLCLKTPYTQNLFRTIALVCLLSGTLARIANGTPRISLEIYEKKYEAELGHAFADKPFVRKKLLCACRLYDESNYRKALKYLFQLLQTVEHARDFVPIWLFIALCYTDAGVKDEAIRAYYELLKIDQNNAQVHSNLGSLFASEGDYDLAMQHYNKSIGIKPNHYYAYANRANLYFRMEEYENAISDAKQALEYKNNGAEAAALLTIIYALRDDEESKKKYYHTAIISGQDPQDLDGAIEYFLNEKAAKPESDKV